MCGLEWANSIASANVHEARGMLFLNSSRNTHLLCTTQQRQLAAHDAAATPAAAVAFAAAADDDAA